MTTFNETPDGDQFINSGDSRETSPEIMRAIVFFARDLGEEEALWNGDGFGQICSAGDFWEHVTQNGRHEASDYCWGAAGSRWWPIAPDGATRPGP